MMNSTQAEIISDKQVAEQLEYLSIKIQQGIEKAYQVIKQAEQIQNRIDEYSPTVNKAISVGEKINNWEQVLHQVAEIGDRETIQRLEQGIESASNTVNEVQAQVRHTDYMLNGFMNELQNRLKEVDNFKHKIEQDKQMMENLARKTDDKYQEIKKMFSLICKQQESVTVNHSLTESLSQPIISSTTAKIVDDLYSELDSHVELDK
ncbi:MAG: hypothetical protein MJK14_26120 [Rivularia sp. ALOHA_DT_140]|nr:hypothetical protein [Rivularia sp. ALOHA_DT_140]